MTDAQTRVLVCGGRHYADAKRLFELLDSYDYNYDFSLLIEGAAEGADALARQWAEARQVPVLSFRADWKRHGKAAGPIRNRKMLAEGKPDLVIAFPGGRGTADMVSLAMASGVATIEVPA